MGLELSNHEKRERKGRASGRGEVMLGRERHGQFQDTRYPAVVVEIESNHHGACSRLSLYPVVVAVCSWP